MPPDNVQRARKGDAEALALIWQEHRQWLAAVVLAHMPREAAIEDLLQEVALSVVRSIHTLRDPASLRSWLYRLTVNVAHSALRSRYAKRGREAFDVPDVDMVCDERAEELANNREAVRRAVDAVHALPEMYREVILLRAVRGLTPRHIAEALQIPVLTQTDGSLPSPVLSLGGGRHQSWTQQRFAPVQAGGDGGIFLHCAGPSARGCRR